MRHGFRTDSNGAWEQLIVLTAEHERDVPKVGEVGVRNLSNLLNRIIGIPYTKVITGLHICFQNRAVVSIDKVVKKLRT